MLPSGVGDAGTDALDAEGSVEVSRDVRKDIWQAKAGRLDFAINTDHDVTEAGSGWGTLLSQPQRESAGQPGTVTMGAA